MEAKIIYNLEKIMAILRGELWHVTEPLGLNPTQANILILLTESENSTLSVVAGKLKLSKATVSDSIKSLKGKNFIMQMEHKSDSRIKILMLTETGKKIAGEISDYTKNVAAQIAKMHMSEKATLLESLENLNAKFSRSNFLK
jgi:DNA-binding MarR family transcriptional regulator